MISLAAIKSLLCSSSFRPSFLGGPDWALKSLDSLYILSANLDGRDLWQTRDISQKFLHDPTPKKSIYEQKSLGENFHFFALTSSWPQKQQKWRILLYAHTLFLRHRCVCFFVFLFRWMKTNLYSWIFACPKSIFPWVILDGNVFFSPTAREILFWRSSEMEYGKCGS